MTVDKTIYRGDTKRARDFKHTADTQMGNLRRFGAGPIARMDRGFPGGAQIDSRRVHGLNTNEIYIPEKPQIVTPDWSLARPIIQKQAGTYPAGTTTKLIGPTPGSRVHYTIDGTDPTTSSPAYAGEDIDVGGITLKSRSSKYGRLSDIVTSVYGGGTWEYCRDDFDGGGWIGLTSPLWRAGSIADPWHDWEVYNAYYCPTAVPPVNYAQTVEEYDPTIIPTLPSGSPTWHHLMGLSGDKFKIEVPSSWTGYTNDPKTGYARHHIYVDASAVLLSLADDSSEVEATFNISGTLDYSYRNAYFAAGICFRTDSNFTLYIEYIFTAGGGAFNWSYITCGDGYGNTQNQLISAPSQISFKIIRRIETQTASFYYNTGGGYTLLYSSVGLDNFNATCPGIIMNVKSYDSNLYPKSYGYVECDWFQAKGNYMAWDGSGYNTERTCEACGC